MSRRVLPWRPRRKPNLKRQHKDEHDWDDEEFNGFPDDPIAVPAKSNNPREKRLKREDDEAVDSIVAEEDGGDIELRSSEISDEIQELEDEEAVEAEEKDNGDAPEIPEPESEARSNEPNLPDNEDDDQSDGYYSCTEASDSDGDGTVVPEQDEDDEDEDDLPAVSVASTTNQLSPEEDDLDTIAYWWAGSDPDMFLPNAIHPRGDSALPTPFSLWGVGLKSELATLSRLVDSDTAKGYIEEAFSERTKGKKWLIAQDARVAVAKARNDGKTERDRLGG